MPGTPHAIVRTHTRTYYTLRSFIHSEHILLPVEQVAFQISLAANRNRRNHLSALAIRTEGIRMLIFDGAVSKYRLPTYSSARHLVCCGQLLAGLSDINAFRYRDSKMLTRWRAQCTTASSLSTVPLSVSSKGCASSSGCITGS